MTVPRIPDAAPPPAVRPPTDTELLSTLFELGREVTSVLDLEELLAKIPQLIARLTRFSAFSVYLLDESGRSCESRYAVGYPEERADDAAAARSVQGVVGAAVQEGRPILVNDIRREPRYKGPLRNMLSQLAVPMRRKGKVIGALNLLNEVEGAFTSQDEALLRQFAAHVAVAIENARLFESRAALRRHARDARRDRPRDVVDPRPRRPAHAHRQPDQAADRLPNLRHPAARRGDAASSR